MFDLEYWSQFSWLAWPLFCYVWGFIIRRFIFNETTFPITWFIAAMAIGCWTYSTRSLPSYQANCMECIKHHHNIAVMSYNLASTLAFIALGSFFGWIVLKFKNRKNFFDLPI